MSGAVERGHSTRLCSVWPRFPGVLRPSDAFLDTPDRTGSEAGGRSLWFLSRSHCCQAVMLLFVSQSLDKNRSNNEGEREPRYRDVFAVPMYVVKQDEHWRAASLQQDSYPDGASKMKNCNSNVSARRVRKWRSVALVYRADLARLSSRRAELVVELEKHLRYTEQLQCC